MRARWTACALIIGSLVLGRSQAAAPGEKETGVPATFYQSSRDDTRAPAQPPVAIRDAAVPVPPAAAAAVGSASCTRPFCNGERNSRVPDPHPREPLAVRWRSTLDPQLHPAVIAAAQDRIVVTGQIAWRLFDGKGETVKDDRMGDGELVVDPANGLFYFPDVDGYVAAHRLADGAKAFHLSVYFGDAYRRALIQREGRRMLVVSIEGMRDPLGNRKPRLSVIELQDLGDPFVLSEVGRLKSATRLEYLFRDTVDLRAAVHDGRLVLATGDRLYSADRDLRLQTELTGEFEPLSLSLDETLRAYMVVATENGRFLWVVSPEGQRVMSFPVPADTPPLSTPPIVGYDHRVYLVGGDRLLAVGVDGKLLWQRAGAAIAGAVVTADGHLLVAAGSELLDIAADGAVTVLHATRGDALRTAPVPRGDGEVLVASDEALYCLAP